MYLTQSNIIRGLTKEQYQTLRELCHYAKNLYNVALYNIRQYYFAEGKFLTYESNYHIAKENENYELLQAGVSQQILKVADRSFKSFFNLIKKAKRGEYRFQDIKMPHYLKKDALFPLVLSTNAISIKNGVFTIPMSQEFKRQHPNSKIQIPFPKRLEGKTMKEVRIIPVFGGQYFKIQYVHEVEKELAVLDANKTLAVDFGLVNLATCVDGSNGTSFIMDGRKLKSINHYYNQQHAKYQSIADKQGTKHTKRLAQLTVKRNNRVNDYMKKTARHIINYCLENQIGTLVVGYNVDFKRSINIGKVNNQNFVQIPLGQLRSQLENLCERYGIVYIEQEESYTSKASFVDSDELPTWNGVHQTNVFSGKRICRGLYRSKGGIVLNADVNGALNILRKSKQNYSVELHKGRLASPLRIRLA